MKASYTDLSGEAGAFQASCSPKQLIITQLKRGGLNVFISREEAVWNIRFTQRVNPRAVLITAYPSGRILNPGIEDPRKMSGIETRSRRSAQRRLSRALMATAVRRAGVFPAMPQLRT